jgi:uncharacterized protein
MLDAGARRLVLVLLLVLGGACRLIPQARSEPTRFYTLPMPVPARAHIGAEPFALGLGPITFPSYLDQAQFVTRIDEERVTFAPNDRWAGSLRNQFERALSLRLMGALDTDDVATFPWWPGRRLDASVQLSVLAFEPDASGQARLDALWKVKDGKRDEVLEAGQASIREPIDAGGPEAAVAALDRALDQLAQALAAEIRRVRR